MKKLKTTTLTIVFIAILNLGIGVMIAESGKEKKDRKTVQALYLPIADHYAGVVAYEKYRDKMEKADYKIEKMKSPSLMRAYFRSYDVDMAFILCPIAMDMYAKKPNFKWLGLMHRDGNALAINDILNKDVNLPKKRIDRKPNAKVADAFSKEKNKSGESVEVGVPSLLATHTVVLYKYLKDHGKTLSLGNDLNADVLAVVVAPPKAPSFIKKKNSRSIPAAFEQSLPWVDVVETKGFGHVAWYSKDVIKWPKGHVECIIIATDEAIKNKREAIKEVVYYIQKAGQDIEDARKKGGKAMIAIADMIRKHIPSHNQSAIIESLRPDLNVINYKNLNIDKKGFKQIMDLAIEGKIIRKPIDINNFADESFNVKKIK